MDLYTFSVASKFESASAGLPVEGDEDCEIRALAGDTNSDGGVNLIDVAQVCNFNRVPITDQTAQYDVNEDGSINLIDCALTKSRAGNTAP